MTLEVKFYLFMEKSKAIVLMKSLSVWELKAFEKFVASPFHNPNSSVTDLFKYLKQHYPLFNNNDISYSSLSCKVFRIKKPDVPRFRHTLTELTRLLEKFYMQLSMSENSAAQKKLLSAELFKRGIDKYFSQQISETRKTTDVKKDISYYENLVAWSELSYEFASSRKNRQPDSDLQNLSDNLDNFYLVKKIKYCCEILNRSNIIGTTYTIPLLAPLLSHLENNPHATPLISIYYQTLLTITDNKNEDHFHKLKALLQKHQHEITIKENRDIYAFAQNYCIRQLNTGNLHYLKELFEIYKIVLEEKIIFDNKQLSHADFKNICAVSIRLNELKWADEFILSHAKFLSSEFRKNSVNYNSARLHFARKQFKPAIKLLTTVEFTDVFYHLDAKSLLLKIYFENKEYEPLYSLINTFKIYLKRSKQISEYQRTIYNNLLSRVRLLAQLHAGDKLMSEKIKTELETELPVADMSWLKEKINEL